MNFGSKDAQGTDVSGTILPPGETWTLSGSPYIVVGDVWVASGATLAIDPGVEVKFDGYYSINVNGTLLAVGTEINRIIITSNMVTPAPNDWNRIQINCIGFTDHAEIKYCDISYGSYGIYITSLLKTNIISDNNISLNGLNGIHLDSSNNNVITNNNIFSNIRNGTHLDSSNSNIISNNNVSNNKGGVKLRESLNNNITNNKILSHNEQGIYLGSSSNNNITNNSISSNNWGMYFESSSNNNITNNNISSNNADGIHLVSSSSNNIIGNNITYNDEGIELHASSNNNIIINNNISSNNDFGIHIAGTSNSVIKNNNISNSNEGIRLSESPNNNITGNTMIENGIFIQGFLLESWNTHYIDTFNTVDGKSVHYLKNQTGGTVPAGAGQVILANCTDVRVEGQELTYGTVGILLGYSSNNTINGNTASNNMYGIYLESSHWNNINGNSFSNNTDGIFVRNSNWNNITGNIASSNIMRGIHIISDGGPCSKNNITGNTFSNNWVGISIYATSLNIITNNNVFSNKWSGIFLRSSWDNNIIGNTALDNVNGLFLNNSIWNDILGNTASNNEYGINLDYSDENNIIGNTFYSNVDYGIYLSDASNNTFHYNNIINNMKQVYLDNTTCFNNSWDDGMGKGNYWSDYTGLDDGSNGRTAGDGVGDTEIPHPFVDQGDGYFQLDNYPLLHPVEDYIFLYEGWNLISIPRIQLETNPGIILSPISGFYKTIQWYNATDTNDPWKHNSTTKPPHLNDFDSIDHFIGFWIYITEPSGVLLEYFGAAPGAPQNIPLHVGWNMVGFPSLGNKNRTVGLNNLNFGVEVDAIFTFDAAMQVWEDVGPSDIFELGRGYWVHATQDCTWEVPL